MNDDDEAGDDDAPMAEADDVEARLAAYDEKIAGLEEQLIAQGGVSLAGLARIGTAPTNWHQARVTCTQIGFLPEQIANPCDQYFPVLVAWLRLSFGWHLLAFTHDENFLPRLKI